MTHNLIMQYSITVTLLITLTICSAIPKPDVLKARVYDPELSDQKHKDDGEHNPEYDHEAFLGREESKKFDELSPEESKRRLGLIVDKIDKNNDGFVDKDELKNWIRTVQQKYITSDSERSWKDHALEDGALTWTSYKDKTYGATVNEDMQPDDPNYSYKDMIVRDKRRWEKADEDGDGKLDRQEYTNFLHPEEVEHMRDVVVMETLDDIDKDKDGKISLEEYIADVKEDDKEDDDDDDDDDEHKKDDEEDDDDNEEWLQSEKDEFKKTHDKNGDGFLDSEEMKAWLMPEETESPANEADHLISEADEDADGKLTKDEILEKYDLFAGSQATDFGDIIQNHDEF